MAGYIRRSGKKKRSWRVEYSGGIDPITRKRVRHFFTFTGTKKEAEAALAARTHEQERGIDVAPNKLTVHDVITRFLEQYAKANVAPSTYDRYTSILRQVDAILGGIKLRALRPAHIQAMHARLAEGAVHPRAGEAGKPRPRSSRTVLHHHRVLHKALQWALKLQLIAVNPAKAVDPPRVERPRLRVLTAEEVGALVVAVEDDELRRLIYVAVQTGLRLGELAALRWDDVDLETGMASITRSLQYRHRELTVREPKTARGRRRISLSPDTVEVLREQRAYQLRRRLRAGEAYEGGAVPSRRDRRAAEGQRPFAALSPYAEIFADALGRPRPPHVISLRFKRAAAAAGITGVRFHDLRHTSATLQLRAGTHPKIVQERLGHSTISVTLDTYSHVLPDLQREAAAALDGLLTRPKAARSA